MSRVITWSVVALLAVSGIGWAEDAAAGPASSESPPRSARKAMAEALGFELDTDSPPEILEQSRPKYPEGAFAKCIQGTVVVQIAIDATGRVSDAEVVDSIPALDKAALKCVRRWRFKPAEKGGVPVGTVATAPVSFRAYTEFCRRSDADAAQAAAEAWLELVDRADYSASWEQAASVAKSQTTREQWQASMASMRAAREIVSRKLKSRSDTYENPGLSPCSYRGKYVVLMYAAGLAGEDEADETLVTIRDTGAVWRVAGYSLR